MKTVLKNPLSLSRWKVRGLSLLAGAFFSLSLPPADFWPAIFVSLSALVILLDKIADQTPVKSVRFKQAFGIGWWFGFGYFVVSLYWIGAAFLVEAEKFAVLLPLAVAALPAGLALFWGLATGVASMSWKPGVHRIVILATTLTLAEWIRGHVLTGFPWNSIGYASLGLPGLEQWAAFTGLYGVTFVILLFGFLPVLIIDRNTPCQRQNLVSGCLIVVMIAVVWGVGIIRSFNSGTHAVQTTDNPVVRVVQPAIEQSKKWSRTFREENIDRYFRLSRDNNVTSKTPGQSTADVVIWPETALPLIYSESPDIQKRVAQLLGPDSYLLMGALRRQLSPGGASARQSFYNAVIAIDTNGRVVATYDKFHLVPFGEYLPGERWLQPLGLRKIITLPGGFGSGSGPQTVTIGRLPAFSPLVCYEIGFPGAVVDKENRPRWIVNVTNDGWFGRTAGPHQHLAQARLRAIEQGMPVVRAANTGISAMIDPVGVVVKSLPLGESGAFNVAVPPALPPTFYARHGDLAALAQILGILMIFIGISKLHAGGKQQ